MKSKQRIAWKKCLENDVAEIHTKETKKSDKYLKSSEYDFTTKKHKATDSKKRNGLYFCIIYSAQFKHTNTLSVHTGKGFQTCNVCRLDLRYTYQIRDRLLFTLYTEQVGTPIDSDYVKCRLYQVINFFAIQNFF